MQTSHTIGTAIESRLDEVLLNRLACAIIVGVERNQALRFCAILQALFDDCRHDRLLVREIANDLLQLGIEGETLDIVEQRVDTLTALILLHKLEQLFEHTRCSTRRRHKLHYRKFANARVISRSRTLALLFRENRNTILGRGSGNNAERREAATEILNLLFDLLNGETVTANLF